jgi:hypothetical protein
MKPKWPTEAIACALLIFAGFVAGQTFVNTEVEDINTVLMQSTFRIHGPAVDGTGTSVGTVFIVGRPIKDQPNRGAYVLVTAAHVLESIKGEMGTLLLRQKTAMGHTNRFYTTFQSETRRAALSMGNMEPRMSSLCMSVFLPPSAFRY